MPAVVVTCHLRKVRNRFSGPSYVSTDLVVMKSTKIPGWEGGTLALGFQCAESSQTSVCPISRFPIPAFGLIFYGEQFPIGIFGSGFNVAMAARMIQLRAKLRSALSNLIELG